MVTESDTCFVTLVEWKWSRVSITYGQRKNWQRLEQQFEVWKTRHCFFVLTEAEMGMVSQV